MTEALPVLFAAVIGFGHAFEADHLVAVSSLVTKRTKLKLAMRDGIFWGLGHTSTILLVGAAMIVGQLLIDAVYFRFLEAGVGIMLVVIGILRFRAGFFDSTAGKPEHHNGSTSHHYAAYGVGAVHGLAGSGVMVLLVMTEVKEPLPGMIYLLIFGLGSVAGMWVASGIFSLPFSKQPAHYAKGRLALLGLSAALCVFVGFKIIYQNTLAL